MLYYKANRWSNQNSALMCHVALLKYGQGSSDFAAPQAGRIKFHGESHHLAARNSDDATLLGSNVPSFHYRHVVFNDHPKNAYYICCNTSRVSDVLRQCSFHYRQCSFHVKITKRKRSMFILIVDNFFRVYAPWTPCPPTPKFCPLLGSKSAKGGKSTILIAHLWRVFPPMVVISFGFDRLSIHGSRPDGQIWSQLLKTSPVFQWKWSIPLTFQNCTGDGPFNFFHEIDFSTKGSRERLRGYQASSKVRWMLKVFGNISHVSLLLFAWNDKILSDQPNHRLFSAIGAKRSAMNACAVRSRILYVPDPTGHCQSKNIFVHSSFIHADAEFWLLESMKECWARQTHSFSTREVLILVSWTSGTPS
jgi:hypothetical protein